MKLSTIKKEGQWSNISDRINENFSKVDLAVESLKSVTVKNCGYYSTIAALREAYPTASAGAKAYVGDNFPYAIYLWDSAINDWLDSGETGGTEDVTVNNITENIYEQKFVTQETTINGDVTNNPDNEDLVAEDDKLKFADKAYNKAAFSGLGRVYLRKNMVGGTNVLTQDMLSAENTVYHIQYDYDLEGASIDIRDRSVLVFDGGSLSNGTLRGDNYIVKSPLDCIFSNINFEGAVVKNNVWEAEWFISQRESSLNEQPITDATDELQHLMNCGVENIHFNNKYWLYISRTININHFVNITGVSHKKRPFGNARVLSANTYPSIYTDKAITMIKYSQSAKREDMYKPLNIGGFGLLSIHDYSQNTSINETPLLHIYAGGSLDGVYAAIWGLNIDVDITHNMHYVEGNPQDVFPDKVGILLEAAGEATNYITYINIDGYIQGVLYGVTTKVSGNGAWITSLTDSSNKNWIVSALKCAQGSPIIINGTNQCGYNRFKGLAPDAIFVDCPNNAITLNGTLWDVPIYVKAVKAGYFTNNCPTFMGQVDLMGNNGYTDYYSSTVAEIPHIGRCNNILAGGVRNALSPLYKKLRADVSAHRAFGYAQISDYDIEVYNSSTKVATSVKGTITDEDNIFNPSYMGMPQTNQARYINANYNNVVPRTYGDNTSVRYTFTLSSLFVLDYMSYVLTQCANFATYRIIIEYKDSATNVIGREIVKEAAATDYYRNLHYTQIGSLRGTDNYNYLNSGYSRIIVEYENASAGTVLFPNIGIYNSSYVGLNQCGGNIVGRVNIQDVVHAVPQTNQFLNIYYEYNENYGKPIRLTSSYTSLVKLKSEYYGTENLVSFAFRSGSKLNYIEVAKNVPTAVIADDNITVKVDVYLVNNLIYYDVQAKSKVAQRIEPMRLFSTYGVEFMTDFASEVSGISPTSKEFMSDYYNTVTSTVGDASHKIVKIVVDTYFTGFVYGGYKNDAKALFITMSDGVGSLEGKPTNLKYDILATPTAYNVTAIAYHDTRLGKNVIEVTFPLTNYTSGKVVAINGNVQDVEYIEVSAYDANNCNNLITGINASMPLSGTTTNRPSHNNYNVGTMYFDTTLGKPLWATPQGWKDSTGTLV